MESEAVLHRVLLDRVGIFFSLDSRGASPRLTVSLRLFYTSYGTGENEQIATMDGDWDEVCDSQNCDIAPAALALPCSVAIPLPKASFMIPHGSNVSLLTDRSPGFRSRLRAFMRCRHK